MESATKTQAKNKYQVSIDLLNDAVGKEIATSLQYMYFHFICEDKGYRPLAQYFKRTAIQEMKHAEEFAERILFLEGEVKMVLAKGVKHITEVPEMLDYARELEKGTIEDYNAWSKETAALGDAGSHKLFQDILVVEEGHMDQFRLEMENSKEYGKEYLALQVVDNLKNAE